MTLILTSGGLVRHMLNRIDAGDSWDSYGWLTPVAAFALLATIFATAPRAPVLSAGGGIVSDMDVLTISAKHCMTCHARHPTHESFKEAPKNVMLETIDELKRYANLIMAQTVQNRAMPLGNQTGMTDEERARLGQSIRALK